MRVGIDVRKIDDGGIGTYIRETVAALRRVAPRLEIVVFGSSEARARWAVEPSQWIDVHASHYSVEEHFVLARAARRAGLDVYHAPHYVLPLVLRVPSVVTVHDLIHWLVPRTPFHAFYARGMIAAACRRAGRVLAVSETTARDLETHLGVPSEKIRIVPNAVEKGFGRPPEEEISQRLSTLGISQPYVLFVGNALPHKNVPNLIAAWGALPSPQPALVLCGEGHDRSAVRSAISKARSRSPVYRLGALGRADLAAVYAGAACLASASRYEGFWLPGLEAMACGTPVLAPEAGAVSEITGDAALHVAPHRVDMITDGMYRLLNDPELRTKLVENGKRRLLQFSWEDSARRTVAAYEEVASGAR